MRDIYGDGMYGLIVADALGVPVEFTSRAERKADPVIDMRAYGTYGQPKGTWSDDSSMAIATLDSIREKGELDYEDMMRRFQAWLMKGEYTPFNETFDHGIATANAIQKYRQGIKPFLITEGMLPIIRSLAFISVWEILRNLEICRRRRSEVLDMWWIL